MKTYNYPERKDWHMLVKRPAIGKEILDPAVASIINEVRLKGDKALMRYTLEFDRISLSTLRVSKSEITGSAKKVPQKLKKAIASAKENIEKFHRAQVSCKKETVTETRPGVKCWQKEIPIESVGIYVPGGTASLISTILMLAVPAKIAGCGRIVMCTPPSPDGKISPELLYTAFTSGVDEIYALGGAQAIAAMAYGTGTIKAVMKIFGPGNQYVTRAKQLVQLDGIAIDMPAGPSELLVIADSSAVPEFIAADLLSQAEHGTDSQVVMLTDSKNIISMVRKELAIQLARLPRILVASASLGNSLMVLLDNTDECVEFSNLYAPEHLIISCRNAGKIAGKIINAGSVFIGKYSCESAGDYASGTNHTLPTNGFARAYSGVTTDSFRKKITFQEISREGLLEIGDTIRILAEAENLDGHKNAVTVRLNSTAK